MAKKIEGYIKLQVPAGEAKPAPPPSTPHDASAPPHMGPGFGNPGAM